MQNRSVNDRLQKIIIPIIRDTEELLLRAIRFESKIEGNVDMIAMPDLGLANNSMRMSGGFFTGMYISWESNVPIVPVDSTVNSCGVSLYILDQDLQIDKFEELIENAKKSIGKLGYNWNFQRGNHFITIGQLSDGRTCVAMHASADEYKYSMKDFALYPSTDVWYCDEIKVISLPSNENRFLRYIVGKNAEKFISIATRLEDTNHKRMNDVAESIFGKYLLEELAFVPHYGMPSSNSIAIGCAWNPTVSVLLTAPGKHFYIVEPIVKKSDDIWITPHGLGVSADIQKISYKTDGMYVDDINIRDFNDVKRINNRSIRGSDLSPSEFSAYVTKVISLVGAKVINSFMPIVSICNEGLVVYDNKFERRDK